MTREFTPEELRQRAHERLWWHRGQEAVCRDTAETWGNEADRHRHQAAELERELGGGDAA